MHWMREHQQVYLFFFLNVYRLKFETIVNVVIAYTVYIMLSFEHFICKKNHSFTTSYCLCSSILVIPSCIIKYCFRLFHSLKTEFISFSAQKNIKLRANSFHYSIHILNAWNFGDSSQLQNKTAFLFVDFN